MQAQTRPAELDDATLAFAEHVFHAARIGDRVRLGHLLGHLPEGGYGAEGSTYQQYVIQPMVTLSALLVEEITGRDVMTRGLPPHRRPAVEVMPAAQAAVLRALELDDTAPEAYARLGEIKYVWQWDWTGAGEAFERALELGPNNDTVLNKYAAFLAFQGRFDEAIEMQRRAVELDPLSSRALRELGWTYWYARRYDEGVRWLRKTIELSPNDYPAHLYLSWNYGQMGQPAEAVAALERAAEIHPAPYDDPYHLTVATWVYQGAGQTGRAEAALARMLALRRHGYVPPVLMAVAYVSVGDHDRAFEWIERACEVHDPQLPVLGVAPPLDDLRSDPRFDDLLRRTNAPGPD